MIIGILIIIEAVGYFDICSLEKQAQEYTP